MSPNLNTETEERLNFIIKDFETAWDAVAGLPSSCGSRGNFMFAMQAMILLELACRLCNSDHSALREFSSEIEKRDPRYFWPLPAQVKLRDFPFPTSSGVDPCGPHHHILAVIFDLIRNGQAHQYRQIPATLSDGSTFGVSLTGAAENFFLRTVLSPRRPPDHLSSYREHSNDIWLIMRPDVLFLDIRDSVRAAHLENRTLTPLKRSYKFDKQSLKDCLDRMNRKFTS
jgi:hypothetical protein